MERPLNKTEILNTLFKQYGLYYDGNPNSKDNDVFKHKHYTIITRSGIEKIQKAARITISYKPILVSENAVFLQAHGTKWNEKEEIVDEVETLASASIETSQSKYYPEMAEKRAMSRIVLKLAGLYEYGVYGADETDEWKDAERSRGDSNSAVFKGTLNSNS